MNLLEELLEWVRNPSDAEGRGSPDAGTGNLTPLISRWLGFYQGAPVGDTALVCTGAAQNLPRNVDARSATIQVQGGPIRYSFAGTAPVLATALRADVGTILTIEGIESLWGFQVINETATAATLAITFWA